MMNELVKTIKYIDEQVDRILAENERLRKENAMLLLQVQDLQLRIQDLSWENERSRQMADDLARDAENSY